MKKINPPKFVSSIRRRWKSLPKSRFDGEEVVIFYVAKNEYHGWGHHDFCAYGVNSNKEVVRCTSSGCSCGANVSVEVIGLDILQANMDDVGFSNFPMPQSFEEYGFNSY